MHKFKALVVTALAGSLYANPVFAQPAEFPTRPITLIVGYTPGGSVDLAARIVAPELSKRLGQSVVIENIGGAGGQLGAQKAVNAQPDGYTLLLGTSAEITVARLINPVVKYDGLRDLRPIGLIGTQPMVLVGTPGSTAKNTRQLIDQIRAKPGKFSYGSAGQGSLPHLTGELFKQQTKSFIVHIPYRGASPMITDLLGGQLDLGFLVLSSALPQLKSGKLIAYGVSEPKRLEQLPNVPALTETPDLAGFDMSVFFGVFAPAKTPREIAQRLETELAAVMKQPEVRNKLTEAGFNVQPMDAASTGAFVLKAQGQYQKIVEISKIRE
jgi:tripartite-type tricarboxylate transporter receptor subunit TctC